jgi:hypothetical protein
MRVLDLMGVKWEELGFAYFLAEKIGISCTGIHQQRNNRK